jgi:hypothetical protein
LRNNTVNYEVIERFYYYVFVLWQLVR